MNVSLNHRLRNRLASALFAGATVLAALPGCDSAPSQGSVSMGGKDARENIKPGEIKAADAPPPPAKKTTERSIKLPRTEQ